MEWLAFVPAATLVAAVPGANQMLGLRNTVVHGARRTLLSLAGRLGVFAVMATLTALGLGRLLATSQVAFEVLRWLGVGYLAFLGFRSLRRA